MVWARSDCAPRPLQLRWTAVQGTDFRAPRVVEDVCARGFAAVSPRSMVPSISKNCLVTWLMILLSFITIISPTLVELGTENFNSPSESLALSILSVLFSKCWKGSLLEARKARHAPEGSHRNSHVVNLLKVNVRSAMECLSFIAASQKRAHFGGMNRRVCSTQ